MMTIGLVQKGLVRDGEIITKGQELKLNAVSLQKKAGQSDIEEAIDLHPLKHQSSLQNRDSSLESPQGSPQQVREKIRSNSMQDEHLFVEKFGGQLGKC